VCHSVLVLHQVEVVSHTVVEGFEAHRRSDVPGPVFPLHFADFPWIAFVDCFLREVRKVLPVHHLEDLREVNNVSE